MVEISGENWQGYIDGQCPVQGCGVVDGYPWYFRARGEAWSMEISDDQEVDCECLPLVGFGTGGWIIEEYWGNEFEAGYMESDIALELIKKVIGLFRENKLEFTPPSSSNC